MIGDILPFDVDAHSLSENSNILDGGMFLWLVGLLGERRQAAVLEANFLGCNAWSNGLVEKSLRRGSARTGRTCRRSAPGQHGNQAACGQSAPRQTAA
jgi:hypothetical protein